MDSAPASAPPGVGSDSRWFEAASAAAGMAWAALVLLAPDRLDTLPGYGPLLLFISPRLMGLLMLVACVLQAMAVARNHVLARVPLAAAMGAAWLLMGYAVSLAPSGGPTWAIMAVLGASDVLAMLNLIRLALWRPRGRPGA